MACAAILRELPVCLYIYIGGGITSSQDYRVRHNSSEHLLHLPKAASPPPSFLLSPYLPSLWSRSSTAHCVEQWTVSGAVTSGTGRQERKGHYSTAPFHASLSSFSSSFPLAWSVIVSSHHRCVCLCVPTWTLLLFPHLTLRLPWLGSLAPMLCRLAFIDTSKNFSLSVFVMYFLNSLTIFNAWTFYPVLLA